MKLIKVLAVDIDNTIICSKSDNEFTNDIDDIQLLPGILDRLKKYKAEGYLVFGITNQGGVAYSFTGLDIETVENKLEYVKKLAGGIFEQIFYCANHPNGDIPDYRYVSLLRKPFYGMLVLIEIYLKASKEITVDWNSSLVVGDRDEDKLMAEQANVNFQWTNDFIGSN